MSSDEPSSGKTKEITLDSQTPHAALWVNFSPKLFLLRKKKIPTIPSGLGRCAPPSISISNQFKEDLKKIADLKTLVEDYLPARDLAIQVVQQALQEANNWQTSHFKATQRDFGREMTFPLQY